MKIRDIDWVEPEVLPALTGEYLVATTDGSLRVLNYKEDGWWMGTTKFGSNAIAGWAPAPRLPERCYEQH